MKSGIKPKFDLRQTAELTKDSGETVTVEIEGYELHVTLDEPMYQVRECATRIGYPTMESCLRRWARKGT